MREDPVKRGGVWAIAIAALPGCALIAGEFDFQGCLDAAKDCPAPEASCLVATCVGGVCGEAPSAGGEPCSDQGGKVCDGAGACVECVLDADCTSGACSANACVPAGCADKPCPNGAPCEGGGDCQSGFCDALTCAPCLASASCAQGFYCDVTSGVCAPRLDNGEACSEDEQCSSSSCVDGVCCTTFACPACTACDLNGQGTCSPMPMGVDKTGPNTCDGAMSCDSAGACRIGLGQPCQMSFDCASGLCKSGFCAVPPASCVGGGDGADESCGMFGFYDCCESNLVPGGTFLRSYDGVTFTDMSAPATVSSFRLDLYEVTVGRFRKFVSAVVNGYLPPAGSGKHLHLPGGGLNNGAEPGWDTAWNSELPADSLSWKAKLEGCNGNAQDAAERTWTDAPGANERKPVNCINWWQAYAFCIWDGGFLPSEAEWNYAAAGGSQQRVYPWSSPPASAAIDCSRANYVDVGCASPQIVDVGSKSPGLGPWLHADLAGNVWEWVLDGRESFASPYVVPCNDCIDPWVGTALGSSRAIRGGGFDNDATFQRVSERSQGIQSLGKGHTGMRCARSP